MRIKNRVRKALSQNSRDESLNERGIAGSALVISVKRSLVSAGTEDDSEPIYKYELRVTLPGREAYDVAHSETGHAAAGQTLPVKVDPEDHENLLIDWRAAHAQVTEERTQATQANLSRVEQMFTPSATRADDPAVAPIEGISLERYVELCVGRVKQSIATEEQQDAWLTTQGVEPSVWKAAASGWAERMAAEPAIAMQYAALFQRASA